MRPLTGEDFSQGHLGHTPTWCCDTSSDIQISEKPLKDVPHVEEQGEMIALRLQGKYQLYLAPQSTREHELAIGGTMHPGDSTLVTHQALACMTPASASQPWLAAFSFMTYWSSDTVPHS